MMGNKRLIFLKPNTSDFSYSVINDLNGKFEIIESSTCNDVYDFYCIAKSLPDASVYLNFSDFSGEQKEAAFYYAFKYGWRVLEFEPGEFNYIDFVVDFVGCRLSK